MTYAHVAYDVTDAIARLALSRPERRNILTALTVSELCHALERAREDDGVRCVVLEGSGGVFCGGDTAQLQAEEIDEDAAPPRTFVDLLLILARLGKPSLAMVQGPALAAGLSLVLACDLALAAEGATFGTPEIDFGLWPMVTMAGLERAIGRKHALRLMLTGEAISAAEAARIGLINEVVAAADLERRVLELARRLASRSPGTLRLGLDALHAATDLAYEPALELLERQHAAVLSSPEAQAGVARLRSRG